MENRNYIIELDDAITKNHTGKMHGIQSLSTSCLCNEYCTKRQQNNNSICSKCYAKRELNRKKTLREKMARNTELLTKHDFSLKEIPFINSSIFRLESFGELQNTLQVKNYFSICAKNPHCTFALWTKNAWIIKNAMENYRISKPKNLIIIASMPELNPAPITGISEIFDSHGYNFIDKVFSVYTKQFASDNGIGINCGKKNCIDCMKCYSLNDDDYYINELVKESSEFEIYGKGQA